MPSKQTPEQRAHHYLQASMRASYTGLPAEHREAYEAQMRSHERAYGRVREHALAGTDRDFDKPLTPGEREHQTYLRSQAGMQQADVLRIRKELRGQTPSAGSRPGASARQGSGRRSAGARTARTAAATGASAVTAASTGKGSTGLYIAGVFLLLCMAYLLLAGKGTGAVTGIVNTFVGAVGAFIKPVDPIAAAEQALGAEPISSSGSALASAAAGSGANLGNISVGKGGTPAEKAEVAVISAREGWGQAGQTAWEDVIEDESGWNSDATNASSGAYGIGQFLGATKTAYAQEGATSSNALDQIKAMGDYIKNRYGSPQAALAHENADHWY